MMSEVSISYYDEDLGKLFSKEEEVIERITPFCNNSDREIEVLYSLSVSGNWKLEVKTIKLK